MENKVLNNSPKIYSKRFLLGLLIASQIAPITSLRAESFTGKVVGVSDGDTISVMHSGVAQKVRLNGIDAPEKNQDFGKRSKQFVSNQVFGKSVSVDVQGTDKYGRTIGVVTLANGVVLNNQLIKDGYAWWYRKYAPDDKTLQSLEAEAKAAKRGLWAQSNPVPPWEFRHKQLPRVQPLPSGAMPIVGNRNRRIYHPPNCESYSKVPTRNRVIFENEQAAKQAGYRIAKNCG